jgi:hypothetical protein
LKIKNREKQDMGTRNFQAVTQKTQRALSMATLSLAALLLSACSSGSRLNVERGETRRPIVVYQPSHQSDTGVNFNEALVCNGIVEGAIAASTGVVQVYKVWSYEAEGVHHAREGSNTKIDHTSAVDSLGRISGYAFEIRKSNELKPDVFIAVHNNGATNKNACWGYVHEGDAGEPRNRALAKELVEAVCQASGLDNGGVLGDSSPNRNDYRCKNTGKLSFYSLDENVNGSPIRVLLEIGDNKVSFDLLTDPSKQKEIGRAIQRVVEQRFANSER